MKNDGVYGRQNKILKRIGDEHPAVSDIQVAINAGYGGMMPNGNLVDRRELPEAIPIQANRFLGVPQPKPVKGD